MTVDRDHLDRVLRAFEQEEWDEIHLVAGDFEVHVSASTGESNVTHLWDKSGLEGRRAGATTGTATVTAPGTSRTAASSTPAAATGPATGAADGASHNVAAPSPGIFWRSPSPGAPPFAEVGDRVEPGSTLCIVEVMKLMNHVTADLAGVVVEVLAGNGEQVDRGQPLFRIRPEGA